MASIAALAGMRHEAEKSLAENVTALSKTLGIEVAEPTYARDPEYAAVQRLQYLAAVLTAANGAASKPAKAEPAQADEPKKAPKGKAK